MEKAKNNFIVQIIKGVFTALIVALVGVLIFAGVLKIANLNDGVIKAVNQFIKVLAVFLGCFFSLKEDKGLIKGMLVGLASALLISLTFALICGNLSFGLGFIIDLAFMTVIGIISGIITVNVKGK